MLHLDMHIAMRHDRGAEDKGPSVGSLQDWGDMFCSKCTLPARSTAKAPLSYGRREPLVTGAKGFPNIAWLLAMF
jgi:hypothetical protein